MKTVMNQSHDGWLLKMISRTPKDREHVLEQMSSRGYTKEDIIEIMQKGNKTTGYSKYGVKQFRYNYYDNIVVQNVGDKKIVTVFSNAPASSPHVKGYKIPWK